MEIVAPCHYGVFLRIGLFGISSFLKPTRTETSAFVLAKGFGGLGSFKPVTP